MCYDMPPKSKWETTDVFIIAFESSAAHDFSSLTFSAPSPTVSKYFEEFGTLTITRAHSSLWTSLTDVAHGEDDSSSRFPPELLESLMGTWVESPRDSNYIMIITRRGWFILFVKNNIFHLCDKKHYYNVWCVITYHILIHLTKFRQIYKAQDI